LKNKNTRLGKLKGYWRVDGVGEIKNIKDDAPRATFCFSQLKNTSPENFYKNSFLTNKTIRLEYSLKRIRQFKFGSVWKDGELDSQGSSLRQSFTVDTDNIKSVRLYQSFSLNEGIINSCIPPSYFSFGDNSKYLKDSNFMVVPVVKPLNTQYLVIPQSEIYRYYIGISDRFCNKVATGGLDQFVDFRKSKFGTDSPVLHLKMWLENPESFLLFRYLSNRSSRSAINLPFQSLSSSQLRNTNERTEIPLRIKARFPFEGKTTLTVSGKRFPLFRQGDYKTVAWAILVMSIQACNKPRGFFGESIILTGKNSGKNRTKDGGNFGKGSKTPDPIDDELPENDLSADQRIKRNSSYTPNNGILAMNGWRPRYEKEYRDGHAISRRQESVSPIGVTSAEGNYQEDSKDNLGESSYDSETFDFGEQFENFIQMIKLLKGLARPKGLMVDTLSRGDNESLDSEFITSFPKLRSNKLRWYLVERENGAITPRRVIWVEISNKNNEFVYLIEMEKKTDSESRSSIVLFKNDLSRIGVAYFSDFLRLTAIQRGWPHTLQENKDNKSLMHKKLISELRDTYIIDKISHPKFSSENKNSEPDFSEKMSKWATSTFTSILQKLR